MDKAEPPGRSAEEPPSTPETSASSSDSRVNVKPVRINVTVDCVEHETGIVGTRIGGVLTRPLQILFDNATVQEVPQGDDQRPLRKTIAAFQGVIREPLNAHGGRYKGSISVAPDKLLIVQDNLRNGLEKLQMSYRGGLEQIVIDVEGEQVSVMHGTTPRTTHQAE